MNEAVIVDSTGSVLLSHCKLEPFTKQNGELEAIVPAEMRPFEYLDTPVGRIAPILRG